VGGVKKGPRGVLAHEPDRSPLRCWRHHRFTVTYTYFHTNYYIQTYFIDTTNSKTDLRHGASGCTAWASRAAQRPGVIDLVAPHDCRLDRVTCGFAVRDERGAQRGARARGCGVAGVGTVRAVVVVNVRVHLWCSSWASNVRHRNCLSSADEGMDSNAVW
jgi:hypothetical protein